MDCTGGTASDPNHVGRRTDSGEGILTASHGFTQSESVCCDSELWNIVLAVETLQPWITAQEKKKKENLAGPSGPPPSEVLAFGSLGRGLL